MLCREVGGAPIMDSHQVVATAHGIGGEATIEQYDGDPGAPESGHDPLVHLVLGGGQLERRKEDSGDLLRYVLVTELFGNLLSLLTLSNRISPEQGMLAGQRE